MAKLKVLVLHPAFTNPESYRRGTESIYGPLERSGLAEFHYATAPHEVKLSEVIQPEIWYDGPSLRWLDGNLFGPLGVYTSEAEDAAVGVVKSWVEKEGPFDVFMGYSEGAVTIGAYLYREWEAQGKPGGQEVDWPVRGAIFMGASPPVVSLHGGKLDTLLSSEHVGEIFTLNTLHIVGSQDAIIDKSLELFRLCDEDRATLFDTGKGHIFSRAPKMGDKIQKRITTFLENIADEKAEEQEQEY